MPCVLKVNDKEKYVKSYTPLTGKIEFTNDKNEAKGYTNDWFANAEKTQLEFYANLPVEEGGLDGDPKQIAELVPVLEPYYF